MNGEWFGDYSPRKISNVAQAWGKLWGQLSIIERENPLLYKYFLGLIQIPSLAPDNLPWTSVAFRVGSARN
jgi:hypothetical protein